MSGNIILFEDRHVDDMRPIMFTRPAFAITCATYNLYQVAAEISDRVGTLVRDSVREVSARAFESAPFATEGATLFLNASVAPDVRCVDRLREMMSEGTPGLCTSGQRVAAALLRPGENIPEDLTPESITPYLLGLNLPLRDEVLLKTMDFPFHVVGAQKTLFPANMTHRLASNAYTEVRPGVFVGNNVDLPETAVFHSENGPIVLDDDVTVLDFTYFEGPLYVGPGSRIIERSSIKEFTCTGRTCKIGGEVEASIIEAYSNKQHHGFLGHSYVGSWVNMGAGTSNSDLKNTYGEIRVEHRGARLETGMQFYGCVIGDFSKTAINTSIFTGKTIGVNSMLYGYVARDVPSFCNYAKSFGQVTEVPLEMAVKTQQRMFARRDIEQTDEDIALLKIIFEQTRDERLMSSEVPVL